MAKGHNHNIVFRKRGCVMNDEKDILWDEFTKSGNVADYLKYKGIYRCGNSAEYGYSGISAERPHFCDQHTEYVKPDQMKAR